MRIKCCTPKFMAAVTLLLATCILARPSLAKSEILTQEKLSKLVSAAWKSTPEAYDVTLVKEIRARSLDKDLVRREVERSYALSDEQAVNSGGESREQEMEAEIERILEGQQQPRILRQRIRIDGHLYRLDQQVVRMDNDERTNHRTFVNAGKPLGGDFTHFEYNYSAETASLYNERQMWERHDPLEHQGLPQVVRTIVRGMLGKQIKTAQGIHFIPDSKRINQAAEGSAESLRVEESGVSAAGLTNLHIFVPVADHAIFEIVVSKDDYSQVHSFKAYSPSDGHLMEERTASAFDQDGVPRDVISKRWDADGSLVEVEHIAIETVEVNPDISKLAFQFNPPEGYWVADRRTGAAIALPPSVFEEPELPQNLVSIEQPLSDDTIAAQADGNHASSNVRQPASASNKDTPASSRTTQNRSSLMYVVLGGGGILVVVGVSMYWRSRGGVGSPESGNGN